MASGGRVIVLLYVVIVALMINMSAGDGTVFIFGDSLVDVGTNNFLTQSTARADHAYYGIDYPSKMATGRFSNGLNSIDYIVRYMSNSSLSPPSFFSLYNSTTSPTLELLHGANFASGGAGILNDTGRTFGEVVRLSDQIQQFATLRENLTDMLGKPLCDSFLQNSTYIISAGSNDLFDHEKEVLLGQLPADQLIANLTTNYASHLQNLYNLGARKFGIIGIPPLGCCPVERYVNLTELGGSGGCVDVMNDLAQAFYVSTESLLQNFSSSNPGVIYSLGNAYLMVMEMIQNPREHGFNVVETACCGNGTFNANVTCDVGTNLCDDRDKYLFWDKFHPTEAAAKEAALTLAYANGLEYVTPMNFSSLAKATTHNVAALRH